MKLFSNICAAWIVSIPFAWTTAALAQPILDKYEKEQAAIKECRKKYREAGFIERNPHDNDAHKVRYYVDMLEKKFYRISSPSPTKCSIYGEGASLNKEVDYLCFGTYRDLHYRHCRSADGVLYKIEFNKLIRYNNFEHGVEREVIAIQRPAWFHGLFP